MKRMGACWLIISAGLLLASCGENGRPEENIAAEQNEIAEAPAANDPMAYIRQACPGVYGVAAREMVARLNLASARDFAGKAALAADADLKLLKGAAARAEVSGQSKLGTEVKAVVETKSAVTTEFFHQDQTFQSVACFISAILKDPGLSLEDRAFFEEKRKKITDNRIAYLDVISGLKKN